MEERLNKELISDPSLWRLSVEIKDDALEIAIISTVEDNSMIHRRIPLDKDKGRMASIEDAIYSNPLLLSDFGKTDILIDTNRYIIVPSQVDNEDLRQDLMSMLWPDDDYMVLANGISTSEDTMLMCVDRAEIAFIQRTFPDAKVMHRLTPFITYFYNKDKLNNVSKIYAHLNDNRVDVLYLKNGQIKVANTYIAPTTTDMLYYILAVAHETDFDMENDEIMYCGQPALRERIVPELRKYVKYVMPVVFPSTMIRAGRNVMDTPFELILLPLCE